MTLERIGTDIVKRLPSDKLGSGLFEFYEQFFAPWRHYPIRLVELGVQHGGALVTYARYFRAATLLGVDSNAGLLKRLRAYLAREEPSLSVRLEAGDAADCAWLTTICAAPLDIVIDDCSHQFAQAKASLDCLWPRLRRGGLYIVEDWQAAHVDERYQADGGLPALLQEMLADMAHQNKARLASEITVHRRAFAMRKA